ncbi:MAG TPA: ATP-binding cassette domain-containing protein [Burkholderiales bacterium]|nr:ATP-binding cassette domain-containing protein [Burkholderiales bacterium]
MSAAGSPIVEIADLTFTWPGQRAPCLVIPRLDLEAGERVFLHGPSGSGKSTLLALLGGVLVPQRGTLKVLGRSLEAMPASARDRYRADHVGFIFQLFNLVPYLSVLDNVLLACRFSTRRRERAIAAGGSPQAEATRLLAQLDIDGALLARPVIALSVGQQQRVAAARALLGRPEIVVADEPTSALDAHRQAAFLALLLSECEQAGATLLFVSHDRRLAGDFTREIALPEINGAHTEAA